MFDKSPLFLEWLETFLNEQLSMASFVPDFKIQKSPLSGPLQNACLVKLIYSKSSGTYCNFTKKLPKTFSNYVWRLSEPLICSTPPSDSFENLQVSE